MSSREIDQTDFVCVEERGEIKKILVVYRMQREEEGGAQLL